MAHRVESISTAAVCDLCGHPPGMALCANPGCPERAGACVEHAGYCCRCFAAARAAGVIDTASAPPVAIGTQRHREAVATHLD